MLGYYREQGPRLGVPERYDNTTSGPPDPRPITPASLPTLAQNEGLTQVPLPAAKAWTIDGLAAILRECGPILIGRGFTTSTGLVGGHIIVVVGTIGQGALVVLHDPEVGPNKTLTIDQFNAVFPWDRPEAPWLALVKLPAPTGRSRADAMSEGVRTRPRSNAVVGAPVL
jgi:hypothetical protein